MASHRTTVKLFAGGSGAYCNTVAATTCAPAPHNAAPLFMTTRAPRRLTPSPLGNAHLPTREGYAALAERSPGQRRQRTTMSQAAPTALFSPPSSYAPHSTNSLTVSPCRPLGHTSPPPLPPRSCPRPPSGIYHGCHTPPSPIQPNVKPAPFRRCINGYPTAGRLVLGCR